MYKVVRDIINKMKKIDQEKFNQLFKSVLADYLVAAASIPQKIYERK